MILLITGIPGTGKTTIGNHLQAKYRFEHIDMEKLINSCLNSWLSMCQQVVKKVEQAKNEDTDLVITWGFKPIPECMDMIQVLRDKGATLIWFDGDREAAKKAFLKRNTVHENYFNIQMKAIEKAGLPDSLPAKGLIVFDTFRPGRKTILPKSEIVNQLLKRVRSQGRHVAKK
jgi:adenylate kinase family enzyme